MYDSTISAGAILCVLLSVLLAHRLSQRRDKEKEYDAAITQFKNLLVPFLRNLEAPDANPTLLVTQNFSEHDEAARKLINILPHRKSKIFIRHWRQYALLHEEKKQMGIAAVIAAEVDDLSKTHNLDYLYEQNAKRRAEAYYLVKKALGTL